MLKEQVKSKIREWVEEENRIAKEDVQADIKVILSNQKEIDVWVYVNKNRGDEPAWGPNLDAIQIEIAQLKELQGREFNEDEEEEIQEFAWYCVKIPHYKKLFSQREGNYIEYGSFSDCTKDEFEKAIEVVLDPDISAVEKWGCGKWYTEIKIEV